ncbi:MAG: cbb3-type cytochrome c oxidase subunit I [Microthrixaceae bacterium]|nr:cbb3-type cytochrome c oxidase subunit I [Microthrixaceae bacterium]
MAVTDTTLPEQPTGSATVATPATAGEFEQLIGTGDHTSLGRMFVGFSLLLLVVGLAIRLVVGIDFATDNGVFGSYLPMVDVSSLIALVFLGVLPALLGLAIVIVPLQVGSPSIAFPRAAALSLWAWLVSSGIFVTSIALDGGVGGGDYDAAALGNISFGVMMASLGLAAVCVATTVLAHRPAGMSLARVPLFAWSMLVAASIWIVTFGAAPGLYDPRTCRSRLRCGPVRELRGRNGLGVAGSRGLHAGHPGARHRR